MYDALFDLKDISEEMHQYFDEIEIACGAPWERVKHSETIYDHVTSKPGKSKIGPYAAQTGDGKGTHDIRHGVYSRSVTTGWQPTCKCDADVIPCTVLDPFAGAGTTLLVAEKLGRDSIGIELSVEYAEMSRTRITDQLGTMFTEVVVE